jgi:N4-gp56 family major capsid protein
MPIVLDLQGDGVAGDHTLEGNEENLVNDDVNIHIDQLRNAVKNKGKLAEQKTVIRFRAQARDKLAYWLANRLEQLAILTVAGITYDKTLTGGNRVSGSDLINLQFAADVTAPSTNRVMYAQASYTTTANIVSTDTMTWDMLLRMKTIAVRKRLKPVRIGGKDHYIVILTPEQARDLKRARTTRPSSPAPTRTAR